MSTQKLCFVALLLCNNGIYHAVINKTLFRGQPGSYRILLFIHGTILTLSA
jgi:hypothetical protein